MIIGNREFKSQNEAIEYTRRIAIEYGNLATIESGEDFHYLHSLFKRHPKSIQKAGCGIKAFKIVTNFAGCLAFSIVRVDGSEDDFSYLSCVKGRERPTKGYLNDAMRRAILPQVLVFKEFKAKEFKAKFPEADGVNDFQCDECKIRITKSINAHVDHVIEFNQIRDNFLVNRTDIPTTFLEHYHEPREFMPFDSGFASDWSEFHSEEAIFRILCSQCNSKRLTKNLITKGRSRDE